MDKSVLNESFIKLILTNFHENFASKTILVVVENELSGFVYELATRKVEWLTKQEQDKVLFRAAYLLETIYFQYNELFMPYRERFYDDFLKCHNGSVKRHFSKIMAHILKSYTPSDSTCNDIAEKCVEWVIDSKVKVAVKIWSVDTLLLLTKVEWVGETMESLFDILEKDATPAIKCRLKRWRDVRIV